MKKRMTTISVPVPDDVLDVSEIAFAHPLCCRREMRAISDHAQELHAAGFSRQFLTR